MSIADRIHQVARSASLAYADVCCGDAAQSQSFSFTAETDRAGAKNSSVRRYLIASITKPIVAMAALRLAAEGEFALSDRIGGLLPEFSKAAYRRITVRHLLTHTSGFPDMLPNNAELRAAHASLDAFVEHAADVELDFPTGADCRYSSVGFLLLGRIAEKVTSQSLRQFVANVFFDPLNMCESWLGIPEDDADELLPTVLPSMLPEWQPDADDWGWNSRYWRTLGAPWGGMISTAADLGRFAAMMLAEGSGPDGKQILPAAVIRSAMHDQICSIASEPGFVGSPRAWGFGWRRQWPAHHASFGDFLSEEAVGHWGATGTMISIDPQSRRFGVVLSTTPYEESQSAIQRISNIITTER